MNYIFAFALTLFAGLSTGLGSLISVGVKKDNTKFLAVSMGFSAGVMVYVALVEIFQKGKASLVSALGSRTGSWVTVAAFFLGIGLICLIDRLIPEERNLHGVHKEEGNSLMKTGVFTALAIAIHNFPEGLATFISALQDPSVAIPVAAAIALHNIPEGIAVGVPIYYATGSKKRAFKVSFLSGLTEPLGAVLGFLLLRPFLNDALYGIIFAIVAGIMVFISLDELLPTAQAYGEHQLAIYGLVGGMAVMAVSLLLFL